MPTEVSSQLTFRPRARIIRTIGDQLISGPEAAVIELVKNAYDADATTVTIRFSPPLKPGGGRITVVDDGHGMTLSDIQEKWMEPATSGKAVERRSPGLKRTMMGSKGIGRFAAAKLGRYMALSSVSDREGERRAVLIPLIDWTVFNGEKYLSEIAIDYLTQPSNNPVGTEIEIRDLNETWSEVKLRRLYLELRRLISPLESLGEHNFRIFLELSDYTPETSGFDGAAIVNASNADAEPPRAGVAALNEVTPFPLLTSSDYEVTGSFNDDGVFNGSMRICRAGEGPKDIDLHLPVLDEEAPCGPAGVRLFIFDRDTDAVKSTMIKAGLGSMSAADARAILDRTAGVAIYRDGFRVRPYGDADNDWLTLDRRRVQNPSLRIGHNQIAGYVTVAGGDRSGLEERSSREGFEENAAFVRLRRLVLDLLARVVEPRRFDFREKAGLQRSQTTTFDEVRQVAELQKIRQLLKKFPPLEREAAEKVVNEQSALLFGRIAALEERQRVLEAKSSLGAIIGEVLHEGASPIGFVLRTSGELQRLWKRVVENDVEAREEFPQALHLIRQYSLKLAELFKMLTPLSVGKRGAPELFRPIEPIADAKAVFKSHKTRITVHGGVDAPQILGYSADLNTAMINLLINSVYWLEESATPDPRIDISLVVHGGELIILVEDNGPGVPAEFNSRIFDAGFSLKDGGTGLGLNIAREAIARSGGVLGFHVEHEHGALFEMRFDVGGKK